MSSAVSFGLYHYYQHIQQNIHYKSNFTQWQFIANGFIMDFPYNMIYLYKNGNFTNGNLLRWKITIFE